MTTSFRDAELLSAYLDGQLNPSDSARLESRLIADPQLRSLMDDLRAARRLLRRLPARRAPRNFTLTPSMAGLKAPEPRSYPLFRTATVLATFLFLASFAVNGLAPLAAPRLAAAPAPAFGYGGGGGPEAPQESAPAATQAQAFGAPAPTPTPASDLALAATAQSNAKTLSPGADNAGTAQSPNQLPIPLTWQIALGGLALVCGVAAWSLRSSNERRFRGQWNRK